MSPLHAQLVDLIRHEGPISVERYMAMALGDPRYGYYMTRDPFGAAGDFITSPEISQVFGELLGLWCADSWMRLGSPSPVRLVELGPGRGTLMADALRAMRIVPGLKEAMTVHLVETSPVLQDAQRKTLAGKSDALHWATDIAEVPPGPLLLIANEFFDALPTRQYVRTERGWCERLIGLDDEGQLVFGLAPEPETALARIEGPEGAVYELSLTAQRIMGDIAKRIAITGGAAIIIDYGHVRTGLGDTLQGMKSHRFADVLQNPGETDLTVHVDFAALARVALAHEAEVHGPLPQGVVLRELGIEARMEALSRARPDLAPTFQTALRRLAGDGEGEMGDLFKVMAVTPKGFGPPAAFALDSGTPAS